MKHGVARDDVVDCFAATLSVEGATDIAELAEHVEAIEHHRDAIAPEALG